MKFLTLFHAALVGISTLNIWFLKGHAEAWAFLAGGAIAAFSLVLVFIFTKLIMGQKSVALSVALIVLKYPILGMFLFIAAVLTHWNMIWLSAGLMTAVVTGWTAGFYFHRRSNQFPTE